MIHTLLLLGAAQGFFLAFVLATKRTNYAANQVLAVAMLAFSISLVESLAYMTGFYRTYPHIIGVSVPLVYLFGPIIYLYAKAVSAGGKTFRKAWLLHLVPTGLIALYLGRFFLSSGEYKVAFVERMMRAEVPRDVAILQTFQYPYGVCYVMLTIAVLGRHRERLRDTYSYVDRINLLWLRNLTVAIASIWSMATIFFLLDTAGVPVAGIESTATSLAVAIVVCAIGYFGLKQPEIFQRPPNETPEPVRPVDTNTRAEERPGLTPAQAEACVPKLIRLMEDKQLYRNSLLTLDQLAGELRIAPHQLSQVINTQLGSNFFDFVNGYRVEATKRRLRDPRSAQLAIPEIAQEAGFSTTSSFNTAFKQRTGVTPAQYRGTDWTPRELAQPTPQPAGNVSALGMFVAELRRRRMFRVIGFYGATALGVIYAADVILPRLSAPDWTVTAVIMVAAFGLLVATGLSWAFDVVPAGVVRATAAPALVTMPAPIAVTLDRRAIAVLPFENMSADQDSGYFGDGISEEIINALAQLPQLRVVGRTSAFSFKGRQEDLREIGRQLNVGTVLEGSVRRVNERVRITAQLVDTNNGYHLWSERYDRDLHDIFQVQDEIARAIAQQLAVQLGGGATTTIASHHPDDPEAYQLYLTGRHHISKMTGPAFALAIEAYRAAIDRHPDYALAWTGLAEVELLRGMLMDEPWAESPERGHAAALRALELDDSIAEAHAALGIVQTYYDLDWDGAERSFRRALELNPGSAFVATWYGDLLAWTGRIDEAIAQSMRAKRIEPLASLFRWNVLQNLVIAHKLDEGEKEAKQTLELFPDAFFAHYFLGIIAGLRGNEEQAIAGVKTAIETIGPAPIIASQLAALYYFFGRRAEGDRVFEELNARAAQGHVSAGAFVVMNAARGDVDEAIRWLHIGRDRRDGFFSQLQAWIKTMPFELDGRLADELRRIGFR